MINRNSRSFLVQNLSRALALAGTDFCRITQGYLSLEPEHLVRIRYYNDEKSGTLCVEDGIEGTRVEHVILDCRDLLKLCYRPLVEKVRHSVWVDDNTYWSVDVFQGANEGLVLAEFRRNPAPDRFGAWRGGEFFAYNVVETLDIPSLGRRRGDGRSALR